MKGEWWWAEGDDTGPGGIQAISVGVLGLISLLIYRLFLMRRGVQGSGDGSYAQLDHLALNVRAPTTEWLNMGDWTDTDDFVTANRQLALRLLQAADVRPGAAILDVGCGCGDSLLLLLQESRFRPRLLHGVTSMPAHAERARARLHKAVHSIHGCSDVQTEVFCQDAVRFCEERTGGVQYDYVLALDCAYHFDTRRRFLQAASTLLKPHGTIALQDLMATHRYPHEKHAVFRPSGVLAAPQRTSPALVDSIKHALTLRLAGVPKLNIISAAEYVKDLDLAGLDCIVFHDVSDAVFPGFARFLKQIGLGTQRAWRGGGTAQLLALRQFGDVVERWSQGGDRGMVRSVTVVARRR